MKNKRDVSLLNLFSRVAIAVGILSFYVTSSFGAPYGPDGKDVDYRQPDGTTVKVRVFGDEYYAFTETPEGYIVVYDKQNVLRYGRMLPNGKTIVPTGIRADNNPDHNKLQRLGIEKHIRLTPEGIKEAVNRGLQRMRADRKGRITPESVEYYKKAIKEAKEKAASDPTLAASYAGGDGDDPLVPPPPSFAPPSSTKIGGFVGLCILVDFSDQVGTIPQSAVDDYCNKPGYNGYLNKGSIYDYFYSQSNGKLRYNNIVTAYVRVPNPKTFYDDGVDGVWGDSRAQDLVSDALDALMAQGFDFTQLSRDGSGVIDAINLFYAGTCASGWSTGLWPHRWAIPTKTVDAANGIKAYDYQMTDMGTALDIGTFCHENGHMLLGYADYYDYKTDGIASLGMSSTTLMASYGSDKNPHNIHAYLKMHSGWLNMTDLRGTSTPRRYALRVDSDLGYKFSNPSLSSEYFIFENRAKVGWEANGTLADQGMMITHNHEGGTRDAQNMTEALHYECSVEQADNLFEYEKNTGATDSTDFFHSGGTGPNSSFDDTTSPNAKWWAGAVSGNGDDGTASGLVIHSIGSAGEFISFVYGTGTPSATRIIGLTDKVFNPRCDYGQNAKSQAFGVYNQNGGTLDYTISDDAAWLSLDITAGTASTEVDKITISFSTLGLSAGSYTATITVTDTGASPTTATITVNLTVNPQALLAANPASLSPVGTTGLSGPTVSFALKNTGGGSCNYTITKTQPWLTVSPASGSLVSETDTIYVNCNATSLAAGNYNDTITVTSTEASNSPRTIPVTFTVQSTDMIVASPNGGETFDGSTTQTVTWASSLGGTVKIDLLKGGTVFRTIVASTANDGSYDWAIPAGIGGENFRIRITSIEQGAKTDSSNADFTLYPSGGTCDSFETGLDGWVNDSADDFEWARDSAGTPTASTGPSTGSDGLFYLFTESSSPNFPVKTANIYKDFNFSTVYEPMLVFDYHMYGSTMGTLYLEVSTNNGVSWDAPVAWSLSGDQGDAWHRTLVDLSAYGSLASVRLRFRGVTGSNYYSDMAIDRVCVVDVISSGLMFNSSLYSVQENVGNATITVNRSGSTTGAVSVNYATANGTAISGADYTATNGVLSWGDGDGGAKTFTVAITDDSAHEVVPETIILTLSSPTGTTIIGSNPATLSITDNDNSAPTVNAGLDRSVLMTGGSWSPAEVNLSLWLDADDASTVQLNGATVSSWLDKSGKGRHATQGTAGSQPTDTTAGLNGKHVLTFDGSADYFTINLDFLASVSHSAFIVAKPTIYSDIYGAANPSLSSNSLHVGFASATTYRMNYWGNDASGTVSTNFHAADGNILNYVWIPGATKQIRANGISEVTSGPVAGTISTMSGGGQIGKVVNHPYYGGDIAEMIMVTGTVSTVTREIIEGYLAHKWGIQSYLPTGHTYKAESPNNAAAAANLDGTVNDADNDPLSTVWSVASGPGPVVFGDANAVDTIANFTVQGVYTLRLSASDGMVQTTDDVVITVTTNALPPAIVAPSGLSATAMTTNQIKLAWIDNSTNETGFVIQRSVTSGSGFATIGTAIANTTNYTDNTVSAASTYHYRVSATNATDSSMPSGEASATTPKLPATVTLGSLSQTYDGTARITSYTTSPTGLTVTLTYNGVAVAPTNAGTYAVTGTVANATYAGSTTGTLSVAAKNVSTLTVASAGPFTYTGAAQTPEPQVSDEATMLVKNTHFTYSYAANTNAGTATVTVTGTGNYTGTKNSTFTISPAALTVTPTSGLSKSFGFSDPALTYTSSGAVGGEMPDFSGALSRVAGEAIGSYAITQGLLALADNGVFKTSNYTLSFTAGVNFTILGKSVSTLTVGTVGPFIYDGNPKTPQPVVSDGAVILTNTVSYTLSYTDNTNVGSGTVIVTGAGNYSGTTNKTFTISQATPTNIVWPTAAPIILGQALSNATLNGGSASVPGNFGYVSPATIPQAGVTNAAVVFMPTDSVNYESVDDTVAVTVIDPSAVPFFEPFEARTNGNLNTQYGWVAEGAVVQTNKVFAGFKAAQISGGGGYLKHTFTDGRTKVWADLRVQVVHCPEKPTPETNATVVVYVSTNAMVMAFNGTNALPSGVTVAQGEWVRLTMFSDYVAKTYVLYVNDVRAGKYGFYNAAVTNFTEIKVSGDATFVDNVGLTPNQPAMKYMPSLILLQ